MKKIISFLFILFTITCISQTKSEAAKIVSTYDFESVDALKKFIEIQNAENERLVQEFLSRNVPAVIVDEIGKKAFFRKVIDNTPIYYTSDNVNAAKATRASFLHNGGSLGLNIEGQNMNVATWDGGPTLITHIEFLQIGSTTLSRVTTPDASASNSESQHSTHVSGTIIAKGTSANAKGMAPQAFLKSYDWDNDSQEALTEATTNGLLISNHSYGVPVSVNGNQNAPTWMMGCYSSDARDWDLVANAAPYYLAVMSAGNDGSSTYTGGLAANYDKLTGNKNAKNNMVVANCEDVLLNPNGSGNLLGSVFINTSSSQGPSDDGRVKPDITGNGTGLFSTSNANNTSYATLTGTSMAAPNVSGTMLLLQQYYNQLNGNFMLASTLKGLVCHTADDAGNAGPDAIFGWGLLNAKRAAEVMQKDNTAVPTALIAELDLSQGGTYSVDVTVSGLQKLQATICWNDPAGGPQNSQVNSSTPALVNDLDIRIKKSTTTYLPFKLQLSNVAAAAIKGDNTVDTVEKVEVENPSGIYTIEISHKGNLMNGPQKYSLIITGDAMTLLNREKFEDMKVAVWPNPTADFLNIATDNNSSDPLNVVLFDLQGRKVMERDFSNMQSGATNQVNLSSLPQGVYLIKATQGNKSYNSKVIKK